MAHCNICKVPLDQRLIAYFSGLVLTLGEQRAELRGVNRWLPRRAANEKLPGAPTR
ncbi:MAG: hypothetical protein Q7J29_08610 [Stagnimonas sp.]|nr:hypothetical protein [Stagnimonas sp.]